MRRLIPNPAGAAALRLSLATAAIAWGLAQLQKMHEAAMAALSEVEADAAAAEQRLARLLLEEEEAHERAADRLGPDPAAAVMDDDEAPASASRRLGAVVPEQRTQQGPDFPLVS